MWRNMAVGKITLAVTRSTRWDVTNYRQRDGIELAKNTIYMDVQVKNTRLMGFLFASPSCETNQYDRRGREGQEMEMMVRGSLQRTSRPAPFTARRIASQKIMMMTPIIRWPPEVRQPSQVWRKRHTER